MRLHKKLSNKELPPLNFSRPNKKASRPSPMRKSPDLPKQAPTHRMLLVLLLRSHLERKFLTKTLILSRLRLMLLEPRSLQEESHSFLKLLQLKSTDTMLTRQLVMPERMHSLFLILLLPLKMLTTDNKSMMPILLNNSRLVKEILLTVSESLRHKCKLKSPMLN